MAFLKRKGYSKSIRTKHLKDEQSKKRQAEKKIKEAVGKCQKVLRNGRKNRIIKKVLIELKLYILSKMSMNQEDLYEEPKI